MAVNKQQLKAMRWLYSDDKAYKKAVRELIVKDLKESGDADKLKQYYKTKAKLASKELKTQAKDLKKHVSANYIKTATDFVVLKANVKNVSIVAGVFVLVIVGVNLVSSGSDKVAVEQLPAAGVTGSDATEQLAAASIDPAYDSLLPNATTVTTEQVRYDQDRQVTSFVDSIGDINVTVSMQPLPDEFLGDPDTHVKDLAQGFAATEQINTGTLKAYRGVSVQDGVETVLFTKNKLLVFVQSNGPVPEESLINYIESLE